MAAKVPESELVEKAVAGDRAAIQQLLLDHTSDVTRYVTNRLPVSAQGLIDADDIVQQAFVEAYRSIERFQPQSAGSFGAWLRAIALRCLRNSVKTSQRVKRGGGFRQATQPSEAGSRALVDLVDLLSAGGRTPSQSVARHEAVQAVQQAIENLPDDYRQAVQLRLIEGKCLEEVATVIGRSPRAVQGLVDRAKKKMRAVLGRLSIYE